MMLSDVTSGNRIGIPSAEQGMPIVGRNGSQLTFSALKPGDSIHAKVVSRDGDNVRLQVDGNKYVDAKLSSGINVEAGKDIIFEVRSTSSGITLSPLFTNTSSDPNISKALSMAGLPLTSDTFIMTKNMMQAGMSIDRASLTNMFKDIAAYSGANITDIVDLHRLGITVNNENLEQISAYKNLSYSLGEGMNDVAGKVTELVDNLINPGNVVGDSLSYQNDILSASRLFEGMLDVATEYDWAALSAAEEGVESELITDGQVIDEQNADDISPAQKALRLLEAKAKDIAESDNSATSIQDNVLSSESADKLKNELIKLIGTDNSENLKTDENGIVSKETDIAKLLDNLKTSVNKAIAEGDTRSLLKMIGNPVIKDTVIAAMKAQWNISPAEVADKDNVKELYSRLQRQLGIINETLEASGLKDTAAGNSAGNMSNNLDFLNQVNQMYSYIQLPLKLSAGDDAHGDLYVYSNGKRMSSNDGKVTALLHLDMEHLGALDVYVAMDTSGFDKKVSTQFTVADESILDFLSLHIDELTKRLEAKGYSCNAKMSVRGTDDKSEGEGNSKRGIEPVLDMTGNMKLAEYSFDVRT